MKIVLDTNILVSALLTPMGASSAAFKIIIGHGKICYDLRILTEYKKVLNRKEFGFNKVEVKNIVGFVEKNGLPVTEVLPLPESGFRDPNDRPFLEVALACKADFLITGNKKHFPGKLSGEVEILSPGELLEKFY